MSLQVALTRARDDMRKAVQAMRDYGVKVTEAKEKGEAFGEIEESFQKALADFETLKKQADGFERAIEAEKAVNTVVNAPVGGGSEAHRAGAPSGERETTDRAKKAVGEAFNAYIRFGYGAAMECLSDLGPSERHALLGNQNNLGGFLVPEDFRAEVVKNLAGFAVMRRAGVRTVNTTSSVLVFPSIAGGTDPYSTGVAGTWRAEGAQGTDGTAPDTQNQPTFGQEKVPVHVWQPAAIIITQELLQDSAVSLDSLVSQLIAETKAHDEDYAFLRGDGVGRPRGIMDYVAAASGPSISNVVSASASTFTYNGLIDLMMTLPAQYRQSAAFICRSTAFGEILKLKDSANQPILYQSAIPDTLFGKRVFISEHMPAVAADAYPLVFGDMRFYCIAERTDLRLQRLEERFAPNVGFLATARLGGAVLRTSAFIAQKIAAS